VPVCPLATDCPAAVRSYFTAAFVAEFSVTESTLEVTAEASGLDEKDLMADANVCPFSSSATRSLFGVDELKNLTQLALIAATSAAEPPLAAGVDAEVDAAGADDAAVLAVEDEDEEDEDEDELEQAVSATASVRPAVGTR